MDVDGCIYTDLEPTQELFAVLVQPLERCQTLLIESHWGSRFGFT